MEMPTSVATLMAGARSGPNDPKSYGSEKANARCLATTNGSYRGLSAVATWLWASKHRVWQQAQVQHWGRKLWGHRGQRSLSIQNSLCQSEALLSDVAPNGEIAFTVEQALSVCRPAHTILAGTFLSGQ
ncbi:hypothetical protein F9C07_2589 [Aspergillus flavus]|uniref:Uncharacterized protein n=3 Tax=Aspergillus subgen. Circumdati TaxID=2720871 RepID=A0A7U2MEW8_ASPFN|nr:unnamed protein product [Aspergillus oryzae RIB40]EIT76639.1 hypothetical protein Ao3042_07121 [Aspergillus oryzae 3.042]KDE80340.1 hypothetical protein AO1008_06676 [Aspergillus oryzae 100-8]QRD82487.1 hypothetical protein F9C07_2589 [Aspergillus flavus]BAE57763.1 unnamed protein product [Aspergillus oryzae RIB40]|eukprot:EIT76639.1 hypothetical protein Ao3042_07121 [Aspergillus oryzae 3.042]